VNFITRLIKHELVGGSFFMFAGSTLAAFLAFLLNLFLARSLSYIDYGIFASLLSIVTLASIPAGSINTVLVRFATDHHSKGEIDHLKSFYKKASIFILSLSALILLLFIIFSPLITGFLRLNNILYAVAAGFCVMIGYAQILNTGFLQGLTRFKFLAFVSVVSGIVKIIFGVLLVLLGFGAFSGLGAIFFMGLAAFLIDLIPLKFLFSKKENSDININVKEIIKYALPTIISVLFMTSFASADIILVKHFFNPQQAAFYAGLSLVGRVIFYFTGPIPAVMFPLIIKRYNRNESFNRLFYLALLMVFIPSIAITGFYFLFPKLVVELFLGGRGYLGIAGYVGLFGLNLTIFSLINVFVNFFLSLNKTKIAPLMVLGSLAQIILIYTFHSNFYQVIGISFAVTSTILVILVGYYLKLFVRPLKA